MRDIKTVDIHCHLEHSRFEGIREKIINGIREKMCFAITSGANQGWNRKAIETSLKHDFIYCTIGLHPQDAIKLSLSAFQKELDFIEKNRKNIAGIGEIGLDYHWFKEKEERELQKECFGKLLTMAEELKLPVVIHSWDAEEEVIELLKTFNLKDVVMHCFSGNMIDLKNVLDSGFYVSVSTQVLFSKKHKKIAKQVPLNRIFLETDAPYLDPNHKTNYPWNTLLSAEKIASLKKVSVEEIMRNVLDNSRKVFGISSNL